MISGQFPAIRISGERVYLEPFGSGGPLLRLCNFFFLTSLVHDLGLALLRANYCFFFFFFCRCS